jgi:Swt1-like HEPN
VTWQWTTNRARVDRGLELLASGLGPFVDTWMALESVGGSDWMERPTARRQWQFGGRSRYLLHDSRFLLRVVTEEWGVFKDHLSRIERGFATELRDTGNRWAHSEPFSDDDTYRALDTTERLLIAVGATEQASQVRRIRLELWRCTAACCREPGADVAS